MTDYGCSDTERQGPIRDMPRLKLTQGNPMPERRINMTLEEYEYWRAQQDVMVPWPRRQYHLGSHVVVHEPVEEPAGPWYVRWCTPDGHDKGSYKLTDIDPKADPMDQEAAEELARWMMNKHPTFLWFISNQQALLVLP